MQKVLKGWHTLHPVLKTFSKQQLISLYVAETNGKNREHMKKRIVSRYSSLVKQHSKEKLDAFTKGTENKRE